MYCAAAEIPSIVQPGNQRYDGVWAVEPDPESARALAGSVEEVHAALGGVTRDGFDLALLLDVLEHVPDSAALLREVAARVRPGGALLVSVPNVAHWSVRASLLAGRFDYAPRGIMDRTHLRFFTRRTFRALLEDAGLEVVAEDAAIAPVEQVWTWPMFWILLMSFAVMFGRRYFGDFLGVLKEKWNGGMGG